MFSLSDCFFCFVFKSHGFPCRIDFFVLFLKATVSSQMDFFFLKQRFSKSDGFFYFVLKSNGFQSRIDFLFYFKKQWFSKSDGFFCFVLKSNGFPSRMDFCHGIICCAIHCIILSWHCPSTTRVFSPRQHSSFNLFILKQITHSWHGCNTSSPHL